MNLEGVFHLVFVFQLEKGATNTSKTDGDRSAELRRLQFYGAGPKMAGYNRHSDKFKKKHYEIDPVRIFGILRLVFFQKKRHFS